jgi:hypothetical protein
MSSAAALMTRLARNLTQAVLGEAAVGRLEYLCFPERGNGWGGPFNGQLARARLFQDLIALLPAAAIVETGTFLGATTDFMARTGLPVFTVDGNARCYGFARSRFWRRRNVNVHLGDSREVIRSLFGGALCAYKDRTIFFYLDAHWNDDLPLVEEIDLAFSLCPAAVAMIDDFAVPGDPGYLFDDYGPGKTLNAGYIARAVAAHELTAYYPSTPSAEENGVRRGCVVLCRDDMHGKALSSFLLLRRA